MYVTVTVSALAGAGSLLIATAVPTVNEANASATTAITLRMYFPLGMKKSGTEVPLFTIYMIVPVGSEASICRIFATALKIASEKPTTVIRPLPYIDRSL